MTWLVPITVGALVAAGVYMVLRRSLVKVLLGIVLLGHGANLAVFSMGGLTRGRSAVIPEGALALEPGHADPLPQALVLTAIVIGFAVVAFLAVLIRRAQEALGRDDIDEMKEIEA